MSGAADGRLKRVVQHPSLAWPRSVVRHGLDALAARIAGRLPPPPIPPQPLPPAQIERPLVFDERPVEIGRHILGHQSMLMHHSMDRLDRSLLLQGRIAGQQLAALGKINSLADVEFRVASQWGEDGIIEWLCQKLAGISRSFVEFGVENFAEANTRFLIENRGWRGLVMDGNEAHMRGLRDQALYWRHDLTAVPAFITAENINALITDNGFAGELGILSVDIDGNDYWVLDAIDCVNPAIIICEINGVFGDLRAVTVPYRPDFQRMDAHFSGQYFGCSLAAARMLCERRGYSFVGTNTNGVNAFFVRNDIAAPVLDSLAEIRAWAPRHRDSRNVAGQLDFVRGVARRDLVADMPVVDLATGRLVALSELYPLYSDNFLEDFR
jgi:hypothetical protein